LGNFSSRELTLASEVRLVRPGVARLVLGEDGVLVLHHALYNARGFQETELPAMEFDSADGPALEQLLSGHVFVKISALKCEKDDDRLSIAMSLFMEGLLVVR
jgi:hypothetical protein